MLQKENLKVPSQYAHHCLTKYYAPCTILFSFVVHLVFSLVIIRNISISSSKLSFIIILFNIIIIIWYIQLLSSCGTAFLLCMHCFIAIVIIPFFFHLFTHSFTRILLLLSLCNDKLTLIYIILFFVCLFIRLN